MTQHRQLGIVRPDNRSDHDLILRGISIAASNRRLNRVFQRNTLALNRTNAVDFRLDLPCHIFAFVVAVTLMGRDGPIPNLHHVSPSNNFPTAPEWQFEIDAAASKS